MGGPLSDTANRIGRAGSSGEVEPFVGQQVQEVLGFEGGLEDDLDLGCGLFDGHEGVDPLARHHVNDGEHDPLRTGEVGGVVDPDPVRDPFEPVGPRPLLRTHPGRLVGQDEALSCENTPERGRRDPHEVLVGATVSELAMGPVHRSPLLRDLEDHVDLGGQHRVHRAAARRSVHQAAQLALAGPPAVDPVIGDLPQRAHPALRHPVGDGVVDGLEDQLLDLGGDSRRERTVQPQPDFPRITANSIAWDLIASVSWPISALAASSSQLRSLAGRPGVRASAANAASFTVRRIPITVETSTPHLRAASAWVTSPAVTAKNTSHFVSADSFFGPLRVFDSVTACSSQKIRGDNQPWVISRGTLRVEVRRKPSGLSVPSVGTESRSGRLMVTRVSGTDGQWGQPSIIAMPS